MGQEPWCFTVQSKLKVVQVNCINTLLLACRTGVIFFFVLQASEGKREANAKCECLALRVGLALALARLKNATPVLQATLLYNKLVIVSFINNISAFALRAQRAHLESLCCLHCIELEYIYTTRSNKAKKEKKTHKIVSRDGWTKK